MIPLVNALALLAGVGFGMWLRNLTDTWQRNRYFARERNDG